MTILHRKLLSTNDTSNLYSCSLSNDCGADGGDSYAYAYGYCLWCVHISPSPPPQSPARHHLLPYLISAVCALGVAFLILTTCTILLRYGLSWRRSSTRSLNSTTPDTAFVDEDRGPIIDHPIWHIVTVGLPQSVIDSIATFKFKTGDGLIEGTDCSVCLTEFEDDDHLRLLPKCSHAFHLPCIDTWLSSHKNCPLCRAPVVVAAVNLDSTESHDQGVAQLGGETSQRTDRDDEFENLPIEGVRIAEILKRNRENRVLSDVGENCRIVNEDFHQQGRRSMSLDVSAISNALLVYNVAVGAGEGSSKQDKRIEVDKAAKRVRRDSSMSRLTKSSSIGLSLQKAPVSMKRSLSTSAKIFSSFRGSKSQSSSVLPL